MLKKEESANESIPLKHVLGWGGGLRKSGGDLTLNSLLKTWLSLKHPPSFRAFKKLECQGQVQSVFLMDLNLKSQASLSLPLDTMN